MPIIAIEEHWSMPDLTAALRALPHPDESLVLGEMRDNQERLEDLEAGRIAAMNAQGVDVSILALTPPATQSLPPGEALALSRAANDVAAAAVARNRARLRSMSFWKRAHAFFAECEITVERVLTDNGACYRSRHCATHWQRLGSHTSEPGPTGPRPTARSNASTAPCWTSGPTPAPTAPGRNDVRRSRSGCTPTITAADTPR